MQFFPRKYFLVEVIHTKPLVRQSELKTSSFELVKETDLGSSIDQNQQTAENKNLKKWCVRVQFPIISNFVFYRFPTVELKIILNKRRSFELCLIVKEPLME